MPQIILRTQKLTKTQDKPSFDNLNQLRNQIMITVVLVANNLGGGRPYHLGLVISVKNMI